MARKMYEAGTGSPAPAYSRLTLENKKTRTAYTFLALPLLFFLGIRIAPTLYAFAMSFFKQSGPGYTLSNYEEMFTSQVFWRAIANTLLYVVITVPFQLGIGLVLALLIGRVNRFKGFYRTFYFLPYITSAVAISWVWRLMYDQDNGIINIFLKGLHLPAQKWLHDPQLALISVSIVIIWQASGFSMLIFMAGLESISKSYYEAARIDGASRWNLFWAITWPLLNPTIVFLSVTGVIGALQTFTQIANMTGAAGEKPAARSTARSASWYMYTIKASTILICRLLPRLPSFCFY
ncbi:carbohydrate ABC transporter permease [Paenibacillus protaetiae]|uniref:Sugar ABC transporter permease n=1 Tax=Paenibacillus protaetiae TaxID=2509456 RepID=A0A4P6ETT7_9BACL|nr:sugar ABC transporter permease [Paenibacillus protaetiae]QAY66324.1 sugar ABC transporter permease [Paenibacillus protaetiae]